MPDKRRVMMEMVVKDLPASFANVTLDFPDPSKPPSKQATGSLSPYPNIELSILDSQGREVATIFIVEHKEEFTNLMLHLREPDPNTQYTARAEMTYQEETLEVVEVPFNLTKAD